MLKKIQLLNMVSFNNFNFLALFKGYYNLNTKRKKKKEKNLLILVLFFKRNTPLFSTKSFNFVVFYSGNTK